MEGWRHGGMAPTRHATASFGLGGCAVSLKSAFLGRFVEPRCRGFQNHLPPSQNKKSPGPRVASLLLLGPGFFSFMAEKEEVILS